MPLADSLLSILSTMAGTRLQQHVGSILARADSTINGPHPWDLQVHHPGFYKRVLRQGTLGLVASFMEGWWDCAQRDAFACCIL
jgi:hypothetical protein